MTNTIIFDGDGVVVDTEMIWDRGQEEFLRRRGFVYDRERIKPLLTGVSLIDGVLAMQREYGFSGDPEALARERLEINQEFLKHEVDFISGFVAFFQNVETEYKTCLATAMDRDLLNSIDERLGLSKLFKGNIFCQEDIGCRSKPHPDLFLHAANQLRSKPKDCLVIEDAPYGIEAAKRAGMTCIALTTTYGRERLRGADFVVAGYAEINLATLLKSKMISDNYT